MTILLQDVGSHSQRYADYIFAINAATDRLLLQLERNSGKKIDIPLVSSFLIWFT